MMQFEASYEGIGAMIRSDFMLAAMMVRGAAVMEVAIATAPVGEPKTDPHSGRYKESFELHGENSGGYNHDRAEAMVVNTAPEAIWVEYGNRGKEPYHTMLLALLAGAGDV
jgi:hypothetical protein